MHCAYAICYGYCPQVLCVYDPASCGRSTRDVGLIIVEAESPAPSLAPLAPGLPRPRGSSCRTGPRSLQGGSGDGQQPDCSRSRSSNHSSPALRSTVHQPFFLFPSLVMSSELEEPMWDCTPATMRTWLRIHRVRLTYLSYQHLAIPSDVTRDSTRLSRAEPPYKRKDKYRIESTVQS